MPFREHPEFDCEGLFVRCFLLIPFAVVPGCHGKILKSRSHSVFPPWDFPAHFQEVTPLRSWFSTQLARRADWSTQCRRDLPPCQGCHATSPRVPAHWRTSDCDLSACRSETWPLLCSEWLRSKLGDARVSLWPGTRSQCSKR